MKISLIKNILFTLSSSFKDFFFWSSSFLFTLLVLLISGSISFSNSNFSFQWVLLTSEESMEFFFFFDYISFFFFLTVSIVSSCVLVYSNLYMFGEVLKLKFMILMMIFIFSMFLLSCSADLFWMMIGWDGLGLSSFLLIIYFNNWKSFNSSMITFLSNRLGDGLIIMSLIWFLSEGFSKFFDLNQVSFSFFFFFLILGGLSKSAQIPFSAWLPLAMAAPTPVSSLVHSSTLVTAGIFLLIRFSSFLSEKVLFFIFYISSITIFLAGFSSIGEMDFKKIIALSTLSHIGLMILFISILSMKAAMIHLFIHAMFKSLLFMIAGDIIHECEGFQDLRNLNLSFLNIPMGMSLLISLISMMGIPFFSGFYSKELFLLFLSNSMESLMMYFIFMIAIMLTSSYSFRMIYLLLKKKNKICNLTVSVNMNLFVFFFLSVLSIISGVMVFSILKTEIEFFFFFSLSKMKITVFLFVILGLILGFFFSKLQGNNKIIFFFTKMWWILSTNLFYQKVVFLNSWIFFMKFDSKGMIDLFFISKKKLFSTYSKSMMELFISSPILIMGVISSSLMILSFSWT